ncbi:unnamed protein product [Peronospora effusa]|uniref:Uncharacterized protein n=1 Tax=Peronospora effusa TaxID=542832 RepID=A0A3M6VPF5_9STRA|nr:hypothetical protein DD238_001755 [Peronospora effusa]RQM14699.1 hypothetical protein DD237_005275 [Peronospora effusa]CAI5703477.1 unnamed protein product [Peronospora effusa]
MVKVFAAMTATMTALFGATLAANIDNGFTQDGATTYCMAEKGSVGALIFDSLEVSSVGRCPVSVTLTLTDPKFQVNDPITVKWTATTNQGLADSIFPDAIDPATQLPRPVTMSKLSVCTAGTNCATNVAGTPTGADGTSTGDFVPGGTKALETNTFSLATAGDYIIVGLVALPGNSSLGVAADEYIVFKKISVVSADTTTTTPTSDRPATSETPLTLAPLSSIGSLSAASSPSSSKDATTTTSDSEYIPDSAAEQRVKPNVVSDFSTKKTTTPDGKPKQTEEDMLDSMKPASTSTGSDGIGGKSVAIIAAVVGCCIVGIVGFIFVMRRRKQESTDANKALGTNSSSLASDMDDSIPSSNNGGKIDFTYIANITARNNDLNRADDMMSEESSTAIMSSAARGSEFISSNGSSLHSLPKSSLDTDEYPDNASYGAAGSAGQPNKAKTDAYRTGNVSVLLPSASDTQTSMSNFGDSIVSERQKQYLKSGDLNNSVSSLMDSRLDSVEQAELKTLGFGGIAGLSAVSGLSEDDTSHFEGMSEHHSDRDFSMSSRPSEDSRATVESRFTAGYRATEDSRVSEDFQAVDFSEAMHESRLQSGLSNADSYGFRESRSSVDSYTSGLSSYSREGSRISGFSVDSSLDSPIGSSK